MKINPALVKLSSGDLPLPASITATQLENTVVQFAWDVAFDSEKANKGDQIMMLAYNDEMKAAVADVMGQLRKNGRDMLTLKAGTPGTYHLYAAFISYDRIRQSDSVYLGSVVI
ncbi:DUF6266 family protein [Niastella sp. OAS944]|uniref:DUF6266 family protein n=1 Tax=Niastella sp. OAS944 TaxID=2664089 RepID=UPI00346F61B9|nr:hypothetical protein [Chitinophagaceae bacterium OAS944]